MSVLTGNKRLDFKGIKQVTKSQFESIEAEQKVGYLWLVRGIGTTIDETWEIYLGTRKYGEVSEKEKNKLLYNYVDGELTPDYLMVEENSYNPYILYVVDNFVDFNKCSSETPKEQDRIAEWKQYSSLDVSPEFGRGYSSVIGTHGAAYSDTAISGYGNWNEENHIIKNATNSCDYNGFQMVEPRNSFKFSCIFGTNSGQTTGGWNGFSLVNDENAHPRGFSDENGNEYVRNSLFDLDYDSGTSANWVAWVNENKSNGTAKVVYTNPEQTTDGVYVDRLPGILETLDVYFCPNTSTREGRINTTKTEEAISVYNYHEAYGYVATLNFLIQNTNDITGLRAPYSSGNTCGSVICFAQIYPCGKADYGNDYIQYRENGYEDKTGNFLCLDEQCFFINGYEGSLREPKTVSGYTYMLGEKLVELATQSPSTDDYYSFIRSDVDYNNGVLTVRFSDTIYEKADTLKYHILDNDNLSSNFPLNGSSVSFDFKNGTYTMVARNDYSGTGETETKYMRELQNFKINGLENKIVDISQNYVKTNIDLQQLFSGKLKFMMMSYSTKNMYNKLNTYSYADSIILRNDDNSVWKYDAIDGNYNEVSDDLPTQYFSGSHISFNDITKKLWYSNGTDIKYIGQIYHPCINVKYRELTTLRDNKQLNAGEQYRITDYVTTTSQDGTSSVSGKFDIIVTADDESTLNENARFCQHWYNNGIEYTSDFKDCNLEAWEGKYCLDNDTNRFAWAGYDDAKGVIYYLKDEFGNEAPYDFKNILFTRKRVDEVYGWNEDAETGVNMAFQNHQLTNNSYGTNFYNTHVSSDAKDFYTFSFYNNDDNILIDLSCKQQSPCYENKIEKYTKDGIQYLNGICIIDNAENIDGTDTIIRGNTFGTDNYNITCYGNVFSGNTFGNHVCDVMVGAKFANNTLGNNIQSMVFGNNITNNTFGSHIYNVAFGNNVDSNTFGSNILNNSFHDVVNNNVFGSDASYNTFYRNLTSNRFGSSLSHNIFSGTTQYNTFENRVTYNTFGDGIYLNHCGSEFYGNTFGNTISSSCIGDAFKSNTIGNTFTSNTIGENVYENTFGDGFQNNSIGNNAYKNTFVSNTRYNKFGNDIHGNTFSSGVYYNSFGNLISSNTFGSSLSRNTFGNDISNNAFKSAVYSNNFSNTINGNTFNNNFQYNTVGNGVTNCYFAAYTVYCTIGDGAGNLDFTTNYTTSDNSKFQYIEVIRGFKLSDSAIDVPTGINMGVPYSQLVGNNSANYFTIILPLD